MIGRRLSVLLLFGALAIAAALLLDRLVEPSLRGHLLVSAGLGLLAGLPGFFHRRIAFVSLLLLPAGVYLLLRYHVVLPEGADGWGAASAYYAAEVRDGLVAYADAIFPLTLEGVPGMRILVLLWVYLIIAGAAVLTLGSGRHLTGIAALIGLMAFTFTVDDLSRDLGVAVAVLMLVILLLVSAHGLKRRRWGAGDVVAGASLGIVSVAISLLVLGGLPGLAADGWRDWREWDPFGRGQGEEIVFNWRQNYPRLLDPQNDFPVMAVTAPQPAYWRANVLEHFSGDAWLSEDASYELMPPTGTSLSVPLAEEVPPGEEMEQKFELAGVSTTFLFAGGAPQELTISSGTPVYSSRAGILRAQQALRPPVSYSVRAVVPRLKPEDLVGAGRDYDVPGEYLRLPFPNYEEVARMREMGVDWEAVVAAESIRAGEFLGVYDLNDTIVGSAEDPYDIALRIELYLRDNFEYSLDLPASDLRSPYAAFLFDTRMGYCQQFSGIMAMLLRLNGIPSRVAVGFTSGERQPDGTFLVSTNNAHAWVEAYFPGVGWLPFDPTPGRNLPLPGVSSTSPQFTDPFAHTRGAGESVLPQDPQRPPDRIPESSPLPTPGPGFASPTVRAVEAGLALAVTAGGLALWPWARRRWRGRRLSRGSYEERLTASLRLLRQDLRGWDLPVGPATTLEEAALIVRRESPLDLQPLFDHTQQVLFGGRPASAPDLRALESARRQVSRSFGELRGWRWRVLAAYGAGGLLVSLRHRAGTDGRSSRLSRLLGGERRAAHAGR